MDVNNKTFYLKIMKEYEKLKEIYDTIGFTNYIYDNWFYKNIDWKYILMDIREMIFTQEFIKALERQLIFNYQESQQIKYEQENFEDIVRDSDIEIQVSYWVMWIIYHLNNPVDYIYNLLELWK